ncbi:hypothetical protein GXP67_00985 [Rhodocytophaga rosea]|uniref:Rossmann fold nucleotide-binding protein n=1 Tax=Rhodocytophaga rosea TaxID=2704465 RepID=A0A6C0GBS8_9BACT|nr:hypothetical protein [Rhodocytophaga rosea]QHT65347.1 hypothetical protein GXP67_00985 [Rhodocytophaga rosea]
MSNKKLPFQPIRGELYTSAELSNGFDPNRPESLVEMTDFQTYRYFYMNGRATPADPYVGMMEALHDNSILQAMFEYLTSYKRKVAIMGGHREERSSKNYRSVVALAKRLSEKDYLLASGGGPGAMEATHLGALLKGQNEETVNKAIDLLATRPSLPAGAERVVSPMGEIDYNIVKSLHEWSKPAHELMQQLQQRGESLAVPTWHYGHEPVTPLATHAAKYFQNSIREDVLLMLATQGIIFAPGRAGTLQEVFQDAAQNYYAGDNGIFSPMVFFDADSFWTKTLPIQPLLEGLFKLGGEEREHQYHTNVLYTADIDQIVEFLLERVPSEKQVMVRLKKLGLGPMEKAALS